MIIPSNKTLLIILLIAISSCNDKNSENTPKQKSLSENKNCSCGDLVLDELYNHFYLTDRTLPYTGICNEHHKNGTLYQKKEFIEGKMHGEFLEYSSNKNLLKKWSFNKNKRHGASFTYDSNGKLIFHGIYKNGILDSVILSF